MYINKQYPKKLLSIISHEGDADQNHDEIPLETNEDCYIWGRRGKKVLELLYILDGNVKWYSDCA